MPRKKSLNPLRNIAPRGDRERVWINGQYHYLPGPPGSTAANAAYAKLLTDYAENPNSIPIPTSDDQLVLELVCLWERSQAGPRGHSEKIRVKLCKRLFGELHLEAAVKDFKAADLLAWQNWLCGLKRKKDGQSRYNVESVRKFIGIIRKAFSWGVVAGHVDELQAASLDRVGGPRSGSVRPTTKRKAVSETVFNATLPLLPRPVADMLRLIKATGARPHEIYALRPSDLVKTGELELPISGQIVDLKRLKCWGYLPPNKTEWTGQDRAILFDQAAQSILKPYLINRSPLAYCFCPAEATAAARARQAESRGSGKGKYPYGNRKPRSENPTRMPGEKYTASAVCHAIKRVIDRAVKLAEENKEKCNLTHWSPYQIRHRALQDTRRQFGLDTAQAMAGHSSSATTEARYAPPAVEAAAETVASAGKKRKRKAAG